MMESKCPVVGCDSWFKDVDRFIDHVQKVHVPEFERQQNQHFGKQEGQVIAAPIKLKRRDVEMFLANAREGNGNLPAWADERIQWLCENLLWAMDKATESGLGEAGGENDRAVRQSRDGDGS